MTILTTNAVTKPRQFRKGVKTFSYNFMEEKVYGILKKYAHSNIKFPAKVWLWFVFGALIQCTIPIYFLCFLLMGIGDGVFIFLGIILSVGIIVANLAVMGEVLEKHYIRFRWSKSWFLGFVNIFGILDRRRVIRMMFNANKDIIKQYEESKYSIDQNTLTLIKVIGDNPLNKLDAQNKFTVGYFYINNQTSLLINEVVEKLGELRYQKEQIEKLGLPELVDLLTMLDEQAADLARNYASLKKLRSENEKTFAEVKERIDKLDVARNIANSFSLLKNVEALKLRIEKEQEQANILLCSMRASIELMGRETKQLTA